MSGEDVDDDRGGVDALIKGFAAGGLHRDQPIVPDAGQDLNHLPIAIITALQPAPDRGHRRWKNPVLKRGTIAQSARFTRQNRHIVPGIIDSRAPTKGADMLSDDLHDELPGVPPSMLSDDHSILPDNDPIGIGMHIDGLTDCRGQNRVFVVVKPHRAGFGH